MSAATISGPSGPRREPLSLGTQLRGRSGRQYTYGKYLAASDSIVRDPEGHEHVLKTISKSEFDYQLGLQKSLAGCPYLRVVTDDIQEHLLYTYDYLSDDVLNAARRKDLTLAIRKCILRDALRGLAELHSRGIVHTDIMARLCEEDNPPHPFVAWTHAVDADFRDVVSKMTRLGPEQCITVGEALEHSWFRNFE
ncbi:serine threonine protein kinase [Ophiostoma piceae UAMH 11346]|uniref:Serine threonine protein kinase n=1 Tax=Ophiostoma piceae (strain UAMH 11346) TaxID=1262450 RepID=S3D3X8_OPHP1|nr:serine threonine protein kinase [Ophiostoma piceae UAMH 11346]